MFLLLKRHMKITIIILITDFKRISLEYLIVTFENHLVASTVLAAATWFEPCSQILKISSPGSDFSFPKPSNNLHRTFEWNVNTGFLHPGKSMWCTTVSVGVNHSYAFQFNQRNSPLTPKLNWWNRFNLAIIGFIWDFVFNSIATCKTSGQRKRGKHVQEKAKWKKNMHCKWCE